MRELSITEAGNRNIAVFMGLFPMTIAQWDNYEGKDRDNIYWIEYSPNYHNSWDKLLPVLQKFYDVLDPDGVAVTDVPEWESIAESLMGLDIDRLHRALAAFAERRNNNS
jgi:SAM-dependent methyltransferase